MALEKFIRLMPKIELHVHLEGTIFLQVDKFPKDRILIFGFAVRGQTHDFVLAGIYFEPRIVCERGI